MDKTPKHLWVVGVIALLWSAMGAMDFVMTQSRNASYMEKFTPEQLEYFYGFPAWVVAAWAIAVWGGVLGSVLLLTRKRAAVTVYLMSLVAMVVTTIHNYILSNGLEVAGDAFSLIFSAVIFIVALGLFLYSREMRERAIIT